MPAHAALDAELAREMAAWEGAGLRRELLTAERPDAADFCSNDYLGLARHPVVIEAARAALSEHGAGGRASRLLGGGCVLDARAERAAAEWLGAEAALLFPSGYQANLGLVSALCTRGDALFCDELLHASFIDAARLSRADVRVYRHLDLEHLHALLVHAVGARRRLVVTESIFSMDGDAAPLPELHELCARHAAFLVVDEAHATGVLGPQGAGGWSAAAGADPGARLAARIVTGGKALGVSGAFVVGSAALREHLLNRARPFVFTTALSPAVPGALLAAIALARDGETLREQLRTRASGLARGLQRPAPAAAIVPVLVGESERAVRLAGRLQAEGLDVRAVRPPTVPAGTARLRLVCHADNSEASIALLAAKLRTALQEAPADTAASARPSGGMPEAAWPAADGARPGAVGVAPQPARALVVVGTDTSVGKTVVSALLLRARLRTAPRTAAAQAEALRVAYWKPVQTGPDSDTREVERLLAGHAPARVQLLAPAHALPLPASPHEAAAAAGVRIDFDALAARLAASRGECAGASLLVVELAGGLLVPYDERHTQADLLARAAWPVVLVARSGLGTLNHTLLTLEALALRGISVRALFLVGPPHASNRATLARRSGVKLVYELPPLGAPAGAPASSPPPDGAALDEWLARHDLAPLFA